MRILSLLGRAFRYGAKAYGWASGRRAYPWTLTPPHRLLGFLAARAYVRPGARYRAMYALAGGLLKYRERLYGDRINFSARVAASANSQALLNAALWQAAILAVPPQAPKVHANIRVRDPERVQLDRLMSVLLMSDNLRTINLFFDHAAEHSARVATATVAEEGRGEQSEIYDLNSSQALQSEALDRTDWSIIFSNRTGFERNVNNYLKVAHPGKFVIALGLPETDDGFCDPWLPEWREAIRSFKAPIENISFVVLNAVGPAAFPAEDESSGRSPAFARSAGLTFAETICLVQKADAFVGQKDVFGLAAFTANRPGIYLGSESERLSGISDNAVHTADMTPAQACARLREILARLPKRQHGVPLGATLSARSAVRRSAHKGIGEKYTLLIPTYNRPQLLERLLRYLEHQRAGFPILVADSSNPEMRSQNKSTVSAMDLNVTHAEFDETIDPFAKMRDGLKRIRTPYSSICADDDVVFVAAVQRCVEVLERDRSAAVVHGYYFNFHESETFNLSFVGYRGKSIDHPQPLARLRTLFAAYEAVLYGVYRTEAAQRAWRDVEMVPSVLGKELLTAGLSVIAGKALRITDFYYGRSTGESFSYAGWHPHQVLAQQPEALFTQYPVLRDRLIESLQEGEPSSNIETVIKTIDLVFLRYLEPYLRNDVLDLMLDSSMRGLESGAIVKKVWDVFVRTKRTGHPVEPLLDSRGAFVPAKIGAARPHDYKWDGRRRDGAERSYRIFYEFLFPNMQSTALVERDKLVSLLKSLDAY
jgi:glycosyltransferase domain-containing protein